MPDNSSTHFLSTRWTLVGEAANPDGERAKDALGALFNIYWMPLYRFVRRSGKTKHDAEDLVQGFFMHLLAGDGLCAVNRARGRFRAFLLGALKNYMSNQWRRDHRQKRGGFSTHLSIDWKHAEAGLGLELKDSRSPDRWFDKEWAIALLEKVLDDLASEEPEFSRWKPFLGLNRQRLSYASIAKKFGMTEGAARVAVHRLRKRYRQRLREEIAKTIEDPSMVVDEMRALFSALAED